MIISLIGAFVGQLLDMDPLPEGITCKHFFCIKISFNTNLPLKAGFSLPRPNLLATYVRFRYERLKFLLLLWTSGAYDVFVPSLGSTGLD